MGLPHSRRLRKSSEFRKTFARGRRKGDKFLAVAAAPADNDESRFGFAVSSRVGRAVHRNTIKRRLREICRRIPTNGGWDVVVSARPAARDAAYAQLERSMQRIASKLEITNGHDARRMRREADAGTQ